MYLTGCKWYGVLGVLFLLCPLRDACGRNAKEAAENSGEMTFSMQFRDAPNPESRWRKVFWCRG
ncbi:MAG: hypothetical protein ACI4HQ_15140 [Acetatifactor sp.]